ncbi:MAG TPA: ATP synthase F1 subunit delta [Stenomitos sp.]
MPNHSVAQRYADALFGIAEAQGNLAKVDQDLAAIAQILADHPDMARLWDSAVVSTEDKKAIVKQLFEGKIEPITFNTLLLMFDKQRGGSVATLPRFFRERFDAYRKRVKVNVRTVMALGSDETEELRRVLAKATEREIEMETTLDPDLIGGLVVTVGDKVIDNSLRGRLEALARTLA